jgi:hypothetical protein
MIFFTFKNYLFNYEKNRGKLYNYVRNNRRASSDSDSENEEPKKKKKRVNSSDVSETTNLEQFDTTEMERIKEFLKHVPTNADIEQIREKFKQTHSYRKIWILKQRPTLTDILLEYPILHHHSFLVNLK